MNSVQMRQVMDQADAIMRDWMEALTIDELRGMNKNLDDLIARVGRQRAVCSMAMFDEQIAGLFIVLLRRALCENVASRLEADESGAQ